MALSDAELIAAVEAAPEEKDEAVNEETTNEEATDEAIEENEGDAGATSEEEESDGGSGSDSEDAEGETDEADNDNAPETYTVKVNGEEQTVSLEELQKGYSTNQAAQQKFQDATLARKQAEEFINILKTDPMAVLSRPELGIDLRQLSEQYLAEQINYEQLTDEQKELMSARQQLQAVEQEKRAREQAEHDANLQQLTQQYQEEYNTRINTSLTEAGLPVTEATIRRMAGYMSEALGSDDPAIAKLDDKDLVELVREDYINDFKQMFGASDAQTLTNILGSDVANKIRQADIEKVTGKPASRTAKPVKGKGRKVEPEKKMGTQEWEDFLDSF